MILTEHNNSSSDAPRGDNCRRLGCFTKPNEVVNVEIPIYRSANVVKAGWRYNRNGRKRCFFCKACGRCFTTDDGFLGMWHGKQTITKAMDLHWGTCPSERLRSLRETRALRPQSDVESASLGATWRPVKRPLKPLA